MKVVFLDYDGVVNTPIWKFDSKKHIYIASFNWPEDNKVNDEQAVQWVSEFCQKYNYSIVVSSSWREYSNYKECLINAGLRQGIEIIGCTPNFSDCGGTRGSEITAYLNDHPEVTGYLIFEDAENVFPHEDKTVRCLTANGFQRNEYFTAVNLHYAFNAK